MEKGTDDIYERFLSIVAEGRDMSKEEVHEVAQGRIWSGEDAIKNGLVDVLGGLDDAIDLAANSAELESYSLKYYPYIKENPYKKMISEIMKDQSMVKGIQLSKKERDLLNKYNQLKRFASYEGPMARIPFIFE
jgi:protease-4